MSAGGGSWGIAVLKSRDLSPGIATKIRNPRAGDLAQLGKHWVVRLIPSSKKKKKGLEILHQFSCHFPSISVLSSLETSLDYLCKEDGKQVMIASSEQEVDVHSSGNS